MAVVSEVLAGLDAQETQEAQLDHADRLAAGVHVGELGGGGGGDRTGFRRRTRRK